MARTTDCRTNRVRIRGRVVSPPQIGRSPDPLAEVERLLWLLERNDPAFELSRRIILSLDAAELVGCRARDAQESGPELSALYATRQRLFAARGIATYGFGAAVQKLAREPVAVLECRLTFVTWQAVIFYTLYPLRMISCLGFDRQANPGWLLPSRGDPLWQPDLSTVERQPNNGT